MVTVSAGTAPSQTGARVPAARGPPAMASATPNGRRGDGQARRRGPETPALPRRAGAHPPAAARLADSGEGGRGRGWGGPANEAVHCTHPTTPVPALPSPPPPPPLRPRPRLNPRLSSCTTSLAFSTGCRTSCQPSGTGRWRCGARADGGSILRPFRDVYSALAHHHGATCLRSGGGSCCSSCCRGCRRHGLAAVRRACAPVARAAHVRAATTRVSHARRREDRCPPRYVSSPGTTEASLSRAHN